MRRIVRTSGFARSTAACLLAAWAVLALAPRAAAATRLEIAELDTPPVELTAPSAQTALVGGSLAEIAWRPAAAFAGLAGATEWETFLSVDSGRTYPVRLTPHLDLHRRRFVFRVPDLPSEDVRLLLRIGDEQVERAVRFPTRLRIVRPASPAPVWLEAALAAGPACTPGESALAGGAGILFWVEGDRDGRNLRHRSAVPLGARSASDPILLAAGPQSNGSDESAGHHLSGRRAPTTHPAAARPASPLAGLAAHLTTSDILLLIQRRNE